VLGVVLIAFAASMVGLLKPRVEPSASGDGSAAVPEAQAVPALLSEMEAFRREPVRSGGARPEADATEAAIRVILSNGCGVSGLAARMREELRAAGFDVCGIGTADRDDYEQTVVIDRCGDRAKADAVRDSLQARYGVGRVVLQPRNSPETDVLVILGHDLPAHLEDPATGE
jgi:hypothetical protein